MHSVRRKKTGVYFYDGVIDGKRRRFSLKTKDRRVAVLKADLEEKKFSKEPFVESGNVYRFLDLYREYSLSRKAKHTLECEESIIRVFKSLVRDQPMDNFGVRAADGFFTALESRSKLVDEKNVPIVITAHAKNYYLRSLRMMWNVALAWKMTRENPFISVKKYTAQAKPPRVLNESEINAMLESTKKLFPGMYDLMLFYLFTGMRRNEALDLNWSEVNFDSRYITILRAKQSKFRIVPMFNRTVEILESRKDLPRPFSDQPTGSTVTHAFIDIVRDAKISHAKLHDLRKTHGTMLARYNVNPFTIMQWLGHNNNGVTMAHYIGIDQVTADRLDDFGKSIGRGAVNVP